MFDANPQWGADCVREVEVRSERMGAEAVWEQTISYEDACENTFPITYGAPLRGQSDDDDYDSDGGSDVMVGIPAPSGAAKKLLVGAVYTVSTGTGATGYGCGRFRILPDRQVENLGCS